MSRRKAAQQPRDWQIDEIVVGTPSDSDRAVEMALQIIAQWADGVPWAPARTAAEVAVR